jgi:hypothetical protein
MPCGLKKCCRRYWKLSNRTFLAIKTKHYDIFNKRANLSAWEKVCRIPTFGGKWMRNQISLYKKKQYLRSVDDTYLTQKRAATPTKQSNSLFS